MATSLPTVIVPIYNAAEVLRECLDSLLQTLPVEAKVLLADDASKDPDVAVCVGEFCQRARFELRSLRRERNLGFVGNVNQAMHETAPADVVLLNADTVTSPGWLQRIAECAACDPRIATITPWSNNAEICSFPELCRAAPLPESIERLAAAAAGLEGEPPELPTAVGFCMFIRRACWDALHGFDAATFGRGYGEENDFCLRVAAHGWRNVLCPRAYVAHRGGASFGPEGLRPGGDNAARLSARYPGYNALIADFIRRDPLQPWRAAFAARLAAQA